MCKSGNQSGYKHPCHHLCLRYCCHSVKIQYEENVETRFKNEHIYHGHGHNPETIVISNNTSPCKRTQKNPPNESKVQDNYTTWSRMIKSKIYGRWNFDSLLKNHHFYIYLRLFFSLPVYLLKTYRRGNCCKLSEVSKIIWRWCQVCPEN